MLIKTVILGIVEGITEFLPISSTAHLIIVSRFLGIGQSDFQKFFEVFIQSGAILSVFFLYLNYLWENKKIIYSLIFSFLPTGIVGFVLYRFIKKFFEFNNLINFSLIFVGFLFLLIEFLVKRKKIILKKSILGISYSEAFVIGVFQSLAIVPGVSRAGVVILIMMILGYKRKDSALYSFLLAMPTIFAASFYDAYKMRRFIFSTSFDLKTLSIGFGVSFIFAYFSVKWLINYLQRNSLNFFGIYRIILGFALFIF